MQKLRLGIIGIYVLAALASLVGSGFGVTGCAQSAYYHTLQRRERQVSRRVEQTRRSRPKNVYWPQRRNRIK
jgi:hypothetical protein